MALNLSSEIRETFRKASLQHEAARGLNGDDWARYREIQDSHARRYRDEQREYESEYQTRLEQARKHLVDQAGTKRRTLSYRIFGRDGFNSHEIDRQAHRNVHGDHVRSLARLEAEQDTQLNTLFAAAEKRRELGAQLKQQFGEADDRRSGPERRRDPPR